MSTREPGLNVIIVPEGGGASRTIRLTRGQLWRLKLGAFGGLVIAIVLLVSWPILAYRAARTGPLETRVIELEADRAQVTELVRTLEQLEERYERLRSMFGADQSASASGLWLPPPVSGGSSPETDADALPGAWPLSSRGFITQSLLEDDGGQHPGVDIAVAAETYIRASGAGTVAEVGDDAVYGRYVALDHGQGYSSLYAHASETFVAEGQRVRRGEVIALSGNTGRSTAPHLHFEIMHEGAPVDPLRMVRPPS